MNLKKKELITPCYVIDKKELDNGLNSLKSALEKRWNNYIIGYSYKTNSLPWIVEYFNNNNCYSEVVSEDEYQLGKKLGVDKDKYIYNGPIKTKKTFLEAAKNGCYVNIDSKRELEWALDLKGKYKLGIRVNFDIEKYCPNQSQCGDEGGRFGFCYENDELKKAIDYLNINKIKLSGLHLHVSSKTRSIDIYKSIAIMAKKIITEYGLNLDYIDIGGGFFGGMPNKPSFNDYVNIIADELEKVTSSEKTKLIIEPGISLIGSPISYITTVVDIKDTSYNRFVITDGSRTNIDPLMNKSNYFHEFEYINHNKKKHQKQVICGYTCMEHDRLFIEYDSLELEVDDKIIYKKVGAYTICLTPLFISYYPNVYVKEENDNYYLVRRKWTAKEYIQGSIRGDEIK